MTSEVLLSCDDLARAVSGHRLGSSDAAGFSSVAIDSRKVAPGSLFVALRGAAQDGHAYCREAFARGAVCCLADAAGAAAFGLQDAARDAGCALVVVEGSTLAAFQNAAAAYLDRFPSLLKIAITGSSGKTTTKELAAAMLARAMPTRVVKNEGNLNSETGLPLSAFTVRKEHKAAVFELGMNRPGEIAELAAVFRPGIALITNCGASHVGLIGSTEGIVREKKQVFSRFTGTETALVPAGRPYSGDLAEGVRGRVVFWGGRETGDGGRWTSGRVDGGRADGGRVDGGRADDAAFDWDVPPRELGLEGWRVRVGSADVVFPLGGRHYLADALAAWAIAREAGVGDAAAREALAAAKPLAGRGELFRGPVTLYRDSYNANPDSMREALAFCDALPWKGRKVYVLGEMRELGAASEAAHRAVLSALAKGGADRVFLYGDAWGVGSREWGVGGSAAEREGRDTAIGGTARLEGGAACSHHAATPYSLLPTPYTTLDALRDALDDYLRPGDFVLLKGSRACALEEVCSISALKDLIVNGGDS